MPIAHGNPHPRPPECGSWRHDPWSVSSSGSSGQPSSDTTVAARPRMRSSHGVRHPLLRDRPGGIGGGETVETDPAVGDVSLDERRATPFAPVSASACDASLSACSRPTRPGPTSEVTDRSDRKLRTGKRASSGSGPRWITRQSSAEPMDVGRPRRQAVDDEHDVGLGDPGLRVLPDVHRVVGGDRGGDRPVLAHRDRPPIGEPGERVESVLVAGAALGDHERPPRAGEHLGRAAASSDGGATTRAAAIAGARSSSALGHGSHSTSRGRPR